MFEHVAPSSPPLGNVEIQDAASDGMPVYQPPTEPSRLPNDDDSSQSVQKTRSVSQPGLVMKPTYLGDLPCELITEIAFYVAKDEESSPQTGANESDWQTPSADDEAYGSNPWRVKYDNKQDLPYYFESDDDDGSDITNYPSDYEDSFCLKHLAVPATDSGIRNLRNLTYSCKGLYHVLLPFLYAQSGQQDDWYALRWGCFHGSIPVLEQALAAGAPLNYAFQYTFETEFWREIQSGSMHDRHLIATIGNATTPLLTAIHGGQVEAVDWLLSHGASPTFAKPGIQSLTHWHGFGPDVCNTCRQNQCSEWHCGITPLQGALDYFASNANCASGIRSETDRIRILECLVDRGADINENFDGDAFCCPSDHVRNLPSKHHNALGLALFTPTIGPQTVQFLLDKGAHFNMDRHSLLLPFLTHMSHCNIEESCAYTCESKARVLISNSRHKPHEGCVCIPSYNGLECVEEAQLLGQETYSGHHLGQVLRFLEEYKLPIFDSVLDSIMSKTQPPLIKAAIASTLLLTVPDAVNLFVESGADPNEPHVLNRDLPTPQEDPYGAFTGWTDRHTPITWYCAEAKNHQRDMLTKLLEAGADPSKLDPMGISPLHSVLKHDEDLHQFRGSGINPYRKKDCVEALVKFGADVNARDPRGWTPLHHLCWARGLSIDEKNIDQDDGCNDKNEEIFLRELTQRARSSSLALGEGEEGKEDKEEKEDESWEAFPFASMAISDQCIIGNMRLIAGILMDAGADAGAKTTAAGSHESDDSPSEAGMTPFQVALYCENIVMVRYLRAKGLDFH